MDNFIVKKQIPDFPDYFVHSDGYVISHKNGKETILVGGEALGLSCRALAKIVGCSSPTMQRLVRGEMTNFKNGTL